MAPLVCRGAVPMKIRLLGATFSAGDGISLDEFQAHLEAEEGHSTKFGGHDRIYLTKQHGNYNVGLLVTIKDQKTFCALREKDDGFEVDVHELERGTSLMDFNYFVQSRKTGRALYQVYHHSCALS